MLKDQPKPRTNSFLSLLVYLSKAIILDIEDIIRSEKGVLTSVRSHVNHFRYFRHSIQTSSVENRRLKLIE